MNDVINRGSCRLMKAEACDPYGASPAPVSLVDLLARLTRLELEDLALSFYGREPARFEQLLLEAWARRPDRIGAS